MKSPETDGSPRRPAAVHDVPPGDPHHRLEAEPEPVKVARNPGLHDLAATVAAGRSDRDLRKMDRQSRTGDARHRLADFTRRLHETLPVGDVLTDLRIEEVHLRAHDVDLAAARTQIADLLHVVFAEIVVVDIEFRLRREHAFGEFEPAVRVVARHRTVTAFAEFRTGNHVAAAIIGGALVDDVPAVDFVAVTHGDLDDPFRHKRVQKRRVLGKGLLHFTGGHPFKRIRSSLTQQGVIVRIVFKVRLFQIIERNPVDEPVRNLPAVVPPDKRMSVQANPFRKTELHDRIDGRTPPVRLVFRIGAAVQNSAVSRYSGRKRGRPSSSSSVFQ